MANTRSLIVTIVGDSTSYERALKRSSTASTQFVQESGKVQAVGARLSTLKGIGAGIIASEAVGVLRDFVAEAQRSEVVLGQTKVAVEAAGLSWQQSSRDIEDAANRVSRAASFDDEDVLQSFQLFIRSQKDTEKALDLVALAADVARGRYISLEAATQIVNKAALGQIGGLRRLGIEIDNNATSTQALAALQRQYAGAAQEYSTSSAGAVDRLTTSLGNAKEMIGGALLPVVNDLAEQTELAVAAAGKLAEGLAAVGDISLGPLGDVKDVLIDIAKYTGPQGIFFGGKAAFDALFGPGGAPTGVAGAVTDPSGGISGLVPGATIDPVTGQVRPPGAAAAPSSIFTQQRAPLVNIPQGFQNAILRAQNANDRDGLRSILIKTRQFEEQQLQRAIDAGDTKAVGQIRSNIESLQGQIQSIYQEIASETRRAADAAAAAAEDAKRKAETAARERGDAIAQALDDLSSAVTDGVGAAAAAVQGIATRAKENADGVRDALLAEIDRQQDDADTSRRLRDTKDALRQARVAGGKIGIRNAVEDFADAQRARDRFRIEQSTFTGTTTGAVVISGQINITVPGAGQPEKVARAVLAELQRAGARKAPRFTGRSPGAAVGVPR